MPPFDDEVDRLLSEAGPRDPIPPEHLDSIASAARLAWRRKLREASAARHRSVRRASLLGLAAALAVAVGVAWWWTAGHRAAAERIRIEAVDGPLFLLADGAEPSPLVAGQSLPLGAVLRSSGPSGIGGRASLLLPGGLTVRLDRATHLRIASSSELHLDRGGVYVDTGATDGAASSLLVVTPLGTARDIGTRFIARLAGAPEATLAVRVRDGAIVVEGAGDSYRAEAGEELLLRRDGSHARRRVPVHGPEWEWVLDAAPGYEIEGRTMGEFLDWVERETGWSIRFADPRLEASARQIVLHGDLGTLRPDRAPSAVLPGAGLVGELDDGTLHIRRR